MPFPKGFSLVLTMPALIGALWTVPARAQEEGSVPGAIPDPSTYQGSMEQQRQSDAQDQQFRQQQQQDQPPSYQGYSQSGGYGAPRSSGYVSRADACMSAVAASREFAPLAGKIMLGGADPKAIQMFDLTSKPGPAEKLLLQKWLAARRHCQVIWEAGNYSQAERLANAKWGYNAVTRLTGELLAGQLTYGQFNYRRAMNSVAYADFSRGAR